MLQRSLHAHRTRSVIAHVHLRSNLSPSAILRNYSVTPPLLRRHAVNPSVAIAGFTERLLGVAEIEGEAVTVYNAIPDEVVDVLMHRGDSVRLPPSPDRETPQRRVIRIGEATQVHKASPLRVAPICPHAHECSGCTLQHIDAGEQIYLKQNVMIDTLAQVAQIQPESVLPPIVGASSGFRRKMRFSVQGRLSKSTSDGVDALGLRVGTHAKFRRGIIDISHCSIVDPRFSIVALRALLMTLDLRDRLRCVHVAAADNALAIVLEVSIDEVVPADAQRLREFAAETGYWVYFRGAKSSKSVLLFAGANSTVPSDASLYYDHAYDETFSPSRVRLNFSPENFVQANGDVNRGMVRAVIDALDLRTNDIVLDLFCGIGNFSIPIAAAPARAPPLAAPGGGGCGGGGCGSKSGNSSSANSGGGGCGSGACGSSSSANTSASNGASSSACGTTNSGSRGCGSGACGSSNTTSTGISSTTSASNGTSSDMTSSNGGCGGCGSSKSAVSVPVTAAAIDPCEVKSCTPAAQAACSSQKKQACAESIAAERQATCGSSSSSCGSAPSSSAAVNMTAAAIDPCEVKSCTPAAQAACSSQKKQACAESIALDRATGATAAAAISSSSTPISSDRASRVLAVIGVDFASDAIATAQLNASHNGFGSDSNASPSVQFHCADLSSRGLNIATAAQPAKAPATSSLSSNAVETSAVAPLPAFWTAAQALLSHHGSSSSSSSAAASAPAIKVVLDPSASGALALIQSKLLNDLRVRRVVYVSCDATSFARDTLLLCQGHGFKLASLQAADQFVHSGHAETIALFVR